MQKVAGIIFFISWLFVGCGIDSIFESPKKTLALIVAIIVTVFAAAVITIGDD